MSGTERADLIEQAMRAESVDAIHAVGVALCDRLECDRFHYGAHFPTSLVKPQTVMITGYDKRWMERYDEQHYIDCDPIVSHCYDSVVPLLWESIDTSHSSNPNLVAEFLADARDFGMVSGLSVPIHGAAGEVAVLSLSSTDWSANERRGIREMQYDVAVLAPYLHEAVLRVFEDKAIALRSADLTGRERECLLWAAEGKTAWEISQILGIAERTANFHVNNCIRKLGVTNRTQAVARAVSQRLITPRYF